MHNTKKRPQREAVLVAMHGDGLLQSFGAKHIDVKFLDVPYCPGSEILAEDTFELLLPLRYRRLFWPNMVRASAMHFPLLPTTMARAKQVKDDIAVLNKWGAA